MINQNTFIPIKAAIASFMMELRVATCLDNLFIQTIQEKNFSITSLNAGIIVKYCIFVKRLSDLVEMGMDICHPQVAIMALENRSYKVGKFALDKYNIFQTIWKPELSDIRKYFEQNSNLSVLVQLLHEYDDTDEFGLWQDADSLWIDYPCNIAGGHKFVVKDIDRLVYELTALLVSGAAWPQNLKAHARGCRHLRLALKFLEKKDIKKCKIKQWNRPGAFMSVLFFEFLKYGKDSNLIPCVKLLMMLDLLIGFEFPQSSAISIKENILRFMQLTDKEFLNLAMWQEEKLNRKNIERFSADKNRWVNVYNFLAGDEKDNLLLLEIQQNTPDLEKLEQMLKKYESFPEVVYRHKCKNIFRKADIFELCCRYGMDLSRTFGGYSALHLCLPFLETAKKYWYLPEDAIQKILKAAPVNHLDPKNRTPLVYAMAMVTDEEDHSVIEQLLNAGASLDIPLYGNDTSFMHTAQSLELIRYMVEKGFDANVRNKLGTTPVLTHPIYYDILVYLIRHGGDIHAIDNRGQGVFHSWIAVAQLKYGIVDIEKCVELFYEQDCNINLRDKNGNTPLHLLAERVVLATSQNEPHINNDIINNGKRIVEIFVKKGADPDIKNNNGETVIEYYNRLSREQGELLT